jgi:hypothetical protein
VNLEGVRCGGAVLVAPRLILMAADVLLEKNGQIEQAVFNLLDCSSAVVRVWKVGDCALAELERDMREHWYVRL